MQLSVNESSFYHIKYGQKMVFTHPFAPVPHVPPQSRARVCVLTQAITNKYTFLSFGCLSPVSVRAYARISRDLYLTPVYEKKPCEVQDLLTYNRRKCERDKFQFILGFMKVIFFFRFKKTTHKSEFHFELLPPATLFLITSLSD